MAKQDRTPLVDAAQEFDDQLATYARLGELFLKTPLGSVKHLERANQTLQEIASYFGFSREYARQVYNKLYHGSYSEHQRQRRYR